MPNNTKQRHQEIQKLAFELLADVDVTGAYPFRPLAKELSKRANCHLDTAKRNIAKAARRMRHPDWKPEWGGARPGAGKRIPEISND
jgi:hypothetical protein